MIVEKKALNKSVLFLIANVWKVSKYEGFFGPNTGKYGPEKNSVFGHFSRSETKNKFPPAGIKDSLKIYFH